jgi:hypothetical protein
MRIFPLVYVHVQVYLMALKYPHSTLVEYGHLGAVQALFNLALWEV